MWKPVYALLRDGDLDRELNAEVRFHIEMETEKYIRLGMIPEDARLKALRSFGPMEKHKEETRDARGVSWLEALVGRSAVWRARACSSIRAMRCWRC